MTDSLQPTVEQDQQSRGFWTAVSSCIGQWNTGIHRGNTTTSRLEAISLTISGWKGGIQGSPAFHDNVITRSVQLEHLSPNSSKVTYEFEVTNGPVELGVVCIYCYTCDPKTPCRVEE